MANLLTGVRLLLVAPFYLWMARWDDSALWLCAGALIVAIATDLLDGPIARRRGSASDAGRAFDHTTDFLFVTAGLMALATRNGVPVWLPLVIVIAFGQYVVDSYVLHAERRLKMSALGRWNGVLYFVPLCADVIIRVFDWPLRNLVSWIGWALVWTTLASIVDRLLALRRAAGTARDSRGEETEDPTPR